MRTSASDAALSWKPQQSAGERVNPGDTRSRARVSRVERGRPSDVFRQVARVYELSSLRSTPTPVSGDVILPLMIFAAVKANPPHLVSHLLFTQRFRNQTIGGEESYCLINLMAVAEFLENVDLAALGLGESEKTVIRCVAYINTLPYFSLNNVS